MDLLDEARLSWAGDAFRESLKRVGVRYLGWKPTENAEEHLLRDNGERFLDFLETIVVEAQKRYQNRRGRLVGAIPNVEAEMNELFDRHRFGYRVENQEIRPIGSPVLDEVVVGPALLATRREGWDEVEKAFREAIRHQRGGPDENDDALTAANSAVEAALKAAGFKGANLGPLSKSFKKSAVVPAELRGVPEALDTLIGRSGALRNSYGDSHGKHSGAGDVPQELVDLAVNWAGAFIVYLAEATR